MPLILASFKSALAQDWLVPPGGSYPDSNVESGDRFASAVASWFAMALAGAFPCSTASARKSQLASAAAAALKAGAAAAAGSQLALAVAGYMTGQMFGAGVASPPIATGAAIGMIGATFADLDGSIQQKAQQIATACTVLALSTIVVFPSPTMPPAPVS